MNRWLVAFTLAAVAAPDAPAKEPPPLFVEVVVADSAAARTGPAVGDRVVSYGGRSRSRAAPGALVEGERR